MAEFFFYFPHENIAAPNCWWEIDEKRETRRREKIGFFFFFLIKVVKVPQRNWQKIEIKKNWIKQKDKNQQNEDADLRRESIQSKTTDFGGISRE